MTKDSQTYIDKPFNVRPLVLWAIIVGLTIFFGNLSISYGWWIIGIWLGVIIGFFILLNAIKNKHKDRVFVFLAGNKSFFVATIVLILAAIVSFGITTMVYSNQYHFTGNGEVTGIVRAHRIDDDGFGSVTLANVRFNDQSVSGRVRINVRNLNEESIANISFGNIIRTEAVLSPINVSGFSVNNRIRYSASINGVDIEFIRQSNDFRSIALRHSYNFLHRFMSDGPANLIYSMMFGDRSTLDDEVQQDFRLNGLAHVLAVSGLHVGLIVAIVLGFLKILRLDKKYQFLILIFVVCFYTYLADFRVSILRSGIMFLVLAGNRLLIRRPDFLSSICLAFVIILVLFPYSLFSLGFQLSFGCMFGIALFNRPITNGLKKFLNVPVPFEKFRNLVVSSISMYTTTAITTFPFIIATFGFYSAIGIFANLLLLPILILAFQLSAIALVTYVGFPLLYLVDVMLRFVLHASNALANMSWGQIYINTNSWIMWFYFLGLVIMSRFIFMRRRYRYISAAILFGIYGLALLVLNT
ncbi:MAG: ComEC/Rec2 family competence protein [Firmicutes bacterium]|nr:ComEC/Rec2 family competence protein [Bacillota bacterium]